MSELPLENKKKIVALQKTARPFMTHLRVVEDSVNIFVWFMLPDVK